MVAELFQHAPSYGLIDQIVLDEKNPAIIPPFTLRERVPGYEFLRAGPGIRLAVE